jgi:hypothetical protein
MLADSTVRYTPDLGLRSISRSVSSTDSASRTWVRLARNRSASSRSEGARSLGPYPRDRSRGMISATRFMAFQSGLARC